MEETPVTFMDYIHYWAVYILAVLSGAGAGIIATWRGISGFFHTIATVRTEVNELRKSNANLETRVAFLETGDKRLIVAESAIKNLQSLEPRLTAIEKVISDLTTRPEVLQFRAEMSRRFDAQAKDINERFSNLQRLFEKLLEARGG